MRERSLRVNCIRHLIAFFNLCDANPRIGPTHIYLYLALFRQWVENRFENRIKVVRRLTMKKGKVRSRSTYHAAIRTLHECGYICYYPSENGFENSQVEMIRFDGGGPLKLFAPAQRKK